MGQFELRQCKFGQINYGQPALIEVKFGNFKKLFEMGHLEVGQFDLVKAFFLLPLHSRIQEFV